MLLTLSVISFQVNFLHCCQQDEPETTNQTMRATQPLSSKSTDGSAAHMRSPGGADEASQLSEMQLTETQHIANVGSWEWDVLTNRASWSDELYRIFGVQPQEFGATYEAYLAFVHPADRKLVESTIEHALHHKAFRNYDNRIIRPDGTTRAIQTELKVTLDEAGNVIRLSGTAQDITERKVADRAHQVH
jgi:PAS domain S-box-containing protein